MIGRIGNNMKINKIDWPEINSSSKNKIEKILKDREELDEMYSLLYKNRSLISLAKFRGVEKYHFLSIKTFCKTCLKSKGIRNFYYKETDTISDDCKNCTKKKEIYNIIKGIVYENIENVNK